MDDINNIKVGDILYFGLTHRPTNSMGSLKYQIVKSSNQYIELESIDKTISTFDYVFDYPIESYYPFVVERAKCITSLNNPEETYFSKSEYYAVLGCVKRNRIYCEHLMETLESNLAMRETGLLLLKQLRS